MKFFNFTVDSQLRVLAYSGDFGDARSSLIENGPARPYYEFLPRIVDADNQDAIAKVIHSGQPRFFKGYRFLCLFDCVEADISIDPFGDDGRRICGANVVIKAKECCAFERIMQSSQPLLDIGKAASMLSHGIRNPLNAIKGSVVYLKNRYNNEDELLEFAGIMESEISRLDLFITKFLSSSFLDMEMDQSDVNKLLSKIESYIALQAKSAHVNVRFRYSEVAPLRLNCFHVEQAVLNVLNNAISVMPQGGDIVVESRTETHQDNNFVVIQVTDNGPGMPEGTVNSLEAPQTARARTCGKGFGLFITREVLQAHGGLLEIKSELGKGTTVRLCFPVDQAEGYL